MDHDPTDRGQAPMRSAPTLSSAQPLPAWWPLLAAEMDRLMRLLPPEGHTAEMIGQRAKAAGKYLAERYRNRPEAIEATKAVVTRGLSEWTKFPPPAELVAKIDQWLGFQTTRTDLVEAERRQRAIVQQAQRHHAAQMADIERMKREGRWPPPGWKLDANGLPTLIAPRQPKPRGGGWRHLVD